MKLKYKRVLLKISGEALMGKQSFGIDPSTVSRISQEIETVVKLGVEVCLVVGGGNIFRGLAGASKGMDRVQGDHMGMLATVINGLALQGALEDEGIPTRLQSAIKINEVSEPFIRRKALRHLEKGRVVIFAGGTGNPYMTTDTAAALRALEIGADALIMAKNGIDGVYDSDPLQNPSAKKYERISHHEAISERLQALDSTALSLCMDNSLPIVVFDIFKSGNLASILSGDHVGTLITVEANS